MNFDEHRSLFEKAAEVIRSGGLVIVPTETFYALAADPFQEESVKNIFRVKLRDETKPLPLIAADRDTVDKITVNATPLTKRLMDRFWPGSLTILLEPAIPLPRQLKNAGGKIGVRVPPPCPARVLASLVNGLITATSANLSGHPNSRRVDDVAEGVQRRMDLVMDMGPTPGGKPSTVVEILGQSVRVLREGAVASSVIRDSGFRVH
jgi:L-threonylcarbamoyladenylate synthase